MALSCPPRGLQTRQAMESSISGSAANWLWASEQIVSLICEISVMPLSHSVAGRNTCDNEWKVLSTEPHLPECFNFR